MMIRMTVRVFKEMDRRGYLVNPSYYKKEFYNVWDGPLLPIGTEINVMSYKGKISSTTTDLSEVEMVAEIGVRSQEDFDLLASHLLSLKFASFDVP